MTNSVRPSAKATSVCGELNSRSPVNWLTILTVIVVTGSNGLSGQVGGDAGRQHHDHRLADGARGRQQHGADDARQRRRQHDPADRFRLRGAEPEEPSRRDCGTAEMMSSDSDETNGMIMMPMTNAGGQDAGWQRCRDRSSSPKSRRNGPKVIRAKRP